MRAALHSHILSTRGWEYRTEYSPSGQPKPGYIATRAGATLHTCFRPQHDDPSGWWQLGFLRSYEGMGMARGECIRGCKCAARTFDAHQPATRVSQTAVSKLAVTLLPGGLRRDLSSSSLSSSSRDCPCTIRLTALNHSSSGAHKFKLVALFAGFRMYNPNFALCAVSADGKSRVPKGLGSAHFECKGKES